MEQHSVMDDKRFENPKFALHYAASHSKMSIKFAEKIAAQLSLRNFKRGRILDAGCGSGLTLIELARRFSRSECYGIDLSDPLLETAAESIQKERLADRVKFLKADVRDTPFPDDHFKAVISINMLHIINEPVKMLNEMARVLRPDGFFFIADLRRSFLGFIEREIYSAFTAKEAREIIAESDLPTGRFTSGLIWLRYQSIER